MRLGGREGEYTTYLMPSYPDFLLINKTIISGFLFDPIELLATWEYIKCGYIISTANNGAIALVYSRMLS